MLKNKCKILNVIFTIAFYMMCMSAKAQPARYYSEEEIDLSREGFVYNISGQDTLRAAIIDYDVPDNYYLERISISNTPVLNIYLRAGNLPIRLQIDSTNPNVMVQQCLYDTTNWNTMLELHSFFNTKTDSNYYKKIYTSYDFDNNRRNYINITIVNVHTFFPGLNKIHLILYFRRYI
jgi:hypothetical protein